MKFIDRLILGVLAGSLCVLAVDVVFGIGPAHAQVATIAETLPALSNPLSDLQDTTVDCGATGDPEIIAPSGASSMCVQNTSTTCVHLGGSAVTTATGVDIGDGCAGGQVFCADAKRMWCESAAGTITVDVIFGST